MKPLRFRREYVKYEINGVQYKSLDEVPTEFRKLLEDKDRNGIPDVFDSVLKSKTLDESKSVITFERKIVASSEKDSAASRFMSESDGSVVHRTPIESRQPRSAGKLMFELIVHHPSVTATLVIIIFLLAIGLIWLLQNLT